MSTVLPLIEVAFTSGATLYAILFNRITGQAYNTSTPGWETWNATHWSQYAVALVEKSGSGYYTAAFPAGVAGSLVSCVVYLQAGGSPASGDAPPQVLNHAMGENVAGISGDPAAAPTNLQAVLSSQTQGAVASGTVTASSFPTTLTNANAAAYQGRVLYVTSGAAAGMAALIANYAPTNGVVTLAGGLAVAPSPGDTFVIA